MINIEVSKNVERSLYSITTGSPRQCNILMVVYIYRAFQKINLEQQHPRCVTFSFPSAPRFYTSILYTTKFALRLLIAKFLSSVFGQHSASRAIGSSSKHLRLTRMTQIAKVLQNCLDRLSLYNFIEYNSIIFK
jgi:hypothetical protein